MYRGNHSDYIPDQGPWYSPMGRDNLSPSLITRTGPIRRPATAPGRRKPGRHRKRGRPHRLEPARKIHARYIAAATLTTILAIPVIWIVAAYLIP